MNESEMNLLQIWIHRAETQGQSIYRLTWAMFCVVFPFGCLALVLWLVSLLAEVTK